MSSGNSRVTRGAEKESAKRKREDERKERERKLFASKKIINRNDLPVNLNLGKVKIETDFVKQETTVETQTSSSHKLLEFDEKVFTFGSVDIPFDGSHNYHKAQSDIPNQLEVKMELETEESTMDYKQFNQEQNLIQENLQLKSENKILKQQLNKLQQKLQEMELNSSFSKKEPKEAWANVLPQVIKHMDTNAVLSIRLVCQNWRETIDTNLRNFPTIEQKFDFDKLKTLETFCEAVKFFTRSPFLTKRARFELEPYNSNCFHSAWNSYCTSLKQVLSKFGQHLETLELQQQYFYTPAGWYEILQASLPYVPNLRKLTIRGAAFLEIDVTSTIKRLPKQEHLQELEFFLCHQNIQKLILETAPALKVLTVDVPLEESVSLLQRLKLTKLKASSYDATSCLPSLNALKGNLEHLSLAFRFYKATSFYDLLATLKRFQKLETLSLTGILSIDDVQAIETVESLPAIKNLSLQLCYFGERNKKEIVTDILQPGGFYAKMLEYFPNLRRLSVLENCNSSEPPQNNKNFFEIVYSSEIWTMWQSLDVISLTVHYVYESSALQLPITSAVHKRNRSMWTRDEHQKFVESRELC